MLAGVHRAGINAQNDRPAAAHAYRSGRFFISGKMNKLSAATTQSLLSDRRNELGHSTMIQYRRRLYGLKFKININGVALSGPNPGAIFADREPLLVILAYDLLELIRVDRCSGRRKRLQ